MSENQSGDRKLEGTQCNQALNLDEVGANEYVVLGDAKELTKNGQATATEGNRGHS